MNGCRYSLFGYLCDLNMLSGFCRGVKTRRRFVRRCKILQRYDNWNYEAFLFERLTDDIKHLRTDEQILLPEKDRAIEPVKFVDFGDTHGSLIVNYKCQ